MQSISYIHFWRLLIIGISRLGDKAYKGNLKQNFVKYEHNTRSKYNLRTGFCNATVFQKSMLNMSVRLYKHLPSKFKKIR